MPEFKSREIDGVNYTIELMPISIGLPLLEKLQSVILPVFASRVEYEMGHSDTWISEAIASYLMGYRGLDVYSSAKDLLHNTEISYDVKGSNKCGSGVLVFNNSKSEFSFDTYFSAKYKTLFKVLAFAIEENYPDFFSEAFSYLKTIQEAVSIEKASLEKDSED